MPLSLEAQVIKWGCIILAVVAILFGAFEMGSTHGYKEGWAAQQKTIDAMVDKQNKQTAANNQLIADVEKQAMADADAAREASALASKARSTVITKYKTQYAVVAASCGWDIPTVQAINAIIDSDPDSAAADAQLNSVTTAPPATSTPTTVQPVPDNPAAQAVPTSAPTPTAGKTVTAPSN